MNQHLNDALARARTDIERLAPHWEKAMTAGGIAAALMAARRLRRGGSEAALLADPTWAPADDQERRRDADLLNQLAQMRHQTAMNTIANIR